MLFYGVAMDGQAIVQALVAKDANGDIITEIRQSDGYVNATKMCQAVGKLFADFASAAAAAHLGCM